MELETTTMLRSYQRNAYDLAVNKSLIVVLPTGAGKTLIASCVALSCVKTTRNKVLFLVPTCLLVKQQASAIRYETKLSVAEYMGGASIPQHFDIMVSTPASFLCLHDSNDSFKFRNFALLIFDEVHHVVKRHPYRTIARRMSTIQNPPKILGLTASLTYSMGSTSIQKAIRELCSEFNLGGDCIFTALPEDLMRDGYHSKIAVAELVSEECLELTTDTVSQSLEIPGKVHESLPNFLRHVKERSPPIHPISLIIMDTIKAVETQIKRLDNSFSSPMESKGKNGRVGAWGEYAHKKLLRLTSKSLLFTLYCQLEDLYEATRIIINSRQCGLELAIHYLVMSGHISDEGNLVQINSLPLTSINPISTTTTTTTTTTSFPPLPTVTTHPNLQPLQQAWRHYHRDFFRISQLKEVILQQRDRFNDSFRCIVFVQQRVTTHILQHAVANDEDLCDLNTDVIYATSSPATSKLSVTSSQLQDRIRRFASGELSIIFATSVAEEGMDVPSANCVLRFDPIQTPVSLVQSRGRARQADSAFLVLQDDKKRPLTSLESAEQEQHSAIHKINSEGSINTDELYRKKNEAQQARIRNAKSILTKYFQTLPVAVEKSVGVLKLYAQKVSGEVVEKVDRDGGGNLWYSKVFLSQYGIEDIYSGASHATKKTSIQLAAYGVLQKLHQAV